MKYVFFKIQSAKITTSDTIGKRPDFTSNLTGVDDGEPIRLNHISNALHVLLGVRPVSTKKSTLPWKRCQKIDNIAENGIVRILTPYVSNEGKYPAYTSEIVRGKTHVRNSSRRDLYTKISEKDFCRGVITWDTLKLRYAYQQTEKYEAVMSAFREFTGLEKPEEKYSLAELLRVIGKSSYRETMTGILSKNQITPFIQVMDGATDMENVSSFNEENKTKRENALFVNLASYSNNTKILYKISINAEVIIPMEDEDYSNLIRGNKVATILEGGIIEVDDSKTTDYLDLDSLVEYEGYKKFSNLK